MKTKIFLLWIWLICSSASAQTRTVGLMVNDSSLTYNGYLLFAPKQYTQTYLINNNGKLLHQWVNSKYAPGQSVYLLENGHILRTCMTQGSLGTGGGEGGRVEEYDWNDSLVWYLDYSTSNYMQHHDIRRLPNGNILMLVVEKRTMSQILSAGFDTSKFQPDVKQKGFMLPDCVIEIKPSYPSGGTVVWEWHVWDHLVQNNDSAKQNYGVPSAHPELIDVAGDHRVLPLFWNHMNSIDYNPDLDQVMLSVRGNSEIWVVDHSTTTAQSASHSGGKHGKGGDLLYRWGNPLTYGRGNGSNQTLFEQHDAEWIPKDCPGAGHIMCFNNGVNRNYSSIDEFIPPVDTAGNYQISGSSAFGPTASFWTYKANPPASMYAHDISGTQRLPNGNTIICTGPDGAFYEVTTNGTLAWKYINPVTNTGALHQGDTIPHNPVRPEETMNSVFRVYKYPTTYAAFTGKTLIPGGTIEIDASTALNSFSNPESFDIYPNPAYNNFKITGINEKETCMVQVLDLKGTLLFKFVGNSNDTFDVSALEDGCYLVMVTTQKGVCFKRLLINSIEP